MSAAEDTARQPDAGEEPADDFWMPDIVVSGSSLSSSWDIGSARRMERFIGF
jgi:hypothetical protein